MPLQSRPSLPRLTPYSRQGNATNVVRASSAGDVSESVQRPPVQPFDAHVSSPALEPLIDRMEAVKKWLAEVERVDQKLGNRPINDVSLPPAVTMFNGLLEYVGRKRGFYYKEDDYIPLTAHSPLHMGAAQTTPAWIVTHLGILGEPLPFKENKLWPGSLVRLHDATLSQLNGSFERPWLFGKLGYSARREPGYHIFPVEVDVFIITKSPHIVKCTVAYVAIPNCFIVLQGKLAPMHQQSLGQRVVEELSEIRPPLRPWEADPTWRHPEHLKIEQWRLGLRPQLEKEWSDFNSRD
jgi:hypothetical protein